MTRADNRVLWYILALIVLAMLALMLAQQPIELPTVSLPQLSLYYSELPLTDHAKTAHLNSKHSPAKIAAMFDAGYCTPNECTQAEVQISWCSIDEKNAIGLVISTVTNKIVTGFRATTNYWRNQCP